MQTFQDTLLREIRERPAGERGLAAFGRFVLEPRRLLAAADSLPRPRLRRPLPRRNRTRAPRARLRQLRSRTATCRRLRLTGATAGQRRVHAPVAVHPISGVALYLTSKARSPVGV